MRKYILVAITIAALAGYYLFSFIPFQPIVFEGGEDQPYRTINVDQKFHKKLAVVLKSFYVEHEVKEGKVFIRRIASFDDELISTYTLKALQMNTDTANIDSIR